MSSTSAPRIYTRTGDAGRSSLYTGERRDKDDAIFEAVGTIDELSSSIGVAREYVGEGSAIDEQLRQVQCILQDVGSIIATPVSTARDAHLRKTDLDLEAHVSELEAAIDRFTEELPPLRNFILPSGGHASAFLHLARTVCRRAERRVATVMRDSGDPRLDAVQKYVNRLSDFLFTIARACAKKDGRDEIIYQRPTTRSPKQN